MSDLITDMQRLRKHTTGHPDDEHTVRALQHLGQARDLALAEKEATEKSNVPCLSGSRTPLIR